jgi:uncharacterized protein YndB with AHSA1/START domain
MRPDDTVAEVRHRFAAPPATVFAAFADAALVSRWLTPSPDVALDVLQFDFRVGGSYRCAYHTPGRGAMLVNGVYRLIEPPATIVFSWNIEPPDEHAAIQSEVTIAIAPDGSGTRLVIRHARLEQPGAAERHAEGWRGAIHHLAAILDGPVERGH